ncbi:hypothetical protein [Streptomyces aureus]|uniref:hypothetical protein n=1 Tax=Streptomyces aureus TaxID=193461 RepID=UPI00131DFC74|nr:hypothetical protein [Streptomyces aureus]
MNVTPKRPLVGTKVRVWTTERGTIAPSSAEVSATLVNVMFDVTGETRALPLSSLEVPRVHRPLQWIPLAGDRAADDPEFHFPVVRNGMDYLLSVLEFLDEPTARDIKYAVLHLQAGTEVLLKWPLARRDWRLVVEVNKEGEICDEAHFQRGDFRSIGIPAARRLLKDKLGIAISNRDFRAIKALAEYRNRLQHFGMAGLAAAPVAAIEARAVKVLDFLLDFIHNHLRPHLDAGDSHHVDEQMELVRAGLNRVKALVELRMERVRSDLAAGAPWAVECPQCGQFAMVVDADQAKVECRFCHGAWSSQDAADVYVDAVLKTSTFMSVKDGGEPPVVSCIECAEETLFPRIVVASDRSGTTARCFTCDLIADLVLCDTCGHWMYEDETGMCDSCLSWGQGD